MAETAFGSTSFGTTTPSFRRSALGSFGSATKKNPEDEFDITNTPLYKATQQSASGFLAGETPQFDAQANIARDAQKVAQATAAKAQREQLMNSGLRNSGQYVEEQINTGDQQVRDRAALERQLVTDRDTASTQRMAQGQQTAGALLGMQQNQFENKANRGSSERVAFAGLESQERMQDKALTSNESQFSRSFGLDQAKFGETARQFNISSDQTERQFKDNLTFNYDQLDENQKQFMASLGLDQQKFEATKDQFNRQLEQDGRLQLANLNLQEKGLAQEATQFQSKMEFDKWATQAGLDDRAADRIWQATQNDKQMQTQVSIATMQNDTERWKTTRAEDLTKLGWTREDANLFADRELKTTLATQEMALTREIESGRMTLEEAKMVRQASQFGSELEYKRWATQAGVDDATAARNWQTTERVAAETARATEATFERQLQKEIESGRITFQEKELAQQASQFTSAQEWQKEATKLGLDDQAAARLWQSGEAAANRKQQQDMENVRNALAEKNVKFTSLMAYLETLPAEQAAATMEQVAKDAGITYVKTNPITGETSIESGFEKTVSKSTYEKGDGILKGIESGGYDITQLRNAADPKNPKYEEYKALTEAANTWKPQLSYDDGGLGADKRMINNAPASGTIIKYGGKVYQVASDKVMDKKGQNADTFTVVDINTGETRTIRAVGGQKLPKSNLFAETKRAPLELIGF
jgi:AraC-like DNA-binding protein